MVEKKLNTHLSVDLYVNSYEGFFEKAFIQATLKSPAVGSLRYSLPLELEEKPFLYVVRR